MIYTICGLADIAGSIFERFPTIFPLSFAVKTFGFWLCHIARENPNTGSIAGKRIDRPMQAGARFLQPRHQQLALEDEVFWEFAVEFDEKLVL